jgi:hypothetical protein
VARVSRHVGARGVADQGQASRSFSATGAPPGHLPLARYKTSPPTRRDTRLALVSEATACTFTPDSLSSCAARRAVAPEPDQTFARHGRPVSPAARSLIIAATCAG